MRSFDETPTYNLKVVIQETGIKPDTIRAWERRYGLPNPDRTAGGHRLYSQRDIEMVKWFMLRQEEGFSISRAVDLWRSLEDEGRDPLSDSAFQQAHSTPSLRVDLSAGAALDEIRQAWVDACLAFDEPKAEATITHAFALYPTEIVCTDVLQKGISQIGQHWYEGRVSVQQEHFATALAIRKLNTLISACPSPSELEKIIVACPPQEDHTFSALLITLMLRQRGWPVVYLGANVPLGELRETITNVKPSIVVLSAQQLHTAATLADIAWEIHTQIPIAYGGLIFNSVPEIRKHIPGYFIGEDLVHVVSTIEHFIRQSPPQPQAQSPSEQAHQALTHFRDKQAAIEARIWDKLGSNGIERQHMTIANYHLTQDIEAALTLGKMQFLSNEIAWLEELMVNYDVPAIGLRHFLQAFFYAAQEELDERGAPLLEWLAQSLE